MQQHRNVIIIIVVNDFWEIYSIQMFSKYASRNQKKWSLFEKESSSKVEWVFVASSKKWDYLLTRQIFLFFLLFHFLRCFIASLLCLIDPYPRVSMDKHTLTCTAMHLHAHKHAHTHTHTHIHSPHSNLTHFPLKHFSRSVMATLFLANVDNCGRLLAS